MNNALFFKFLLAIIVSLQFACSTPYLRSDEYRQGEDGFEISEEATILDNAENRELLDVVARYRLALVKKDIGTLRSLISQDYYANAGTTDTTSDDYGFSDLPKIFELLAKHTKDIKYDISIVDMKIDGRMAHVDYKFQYAYHFFVDGKPAWDAGIDVNRLNFVREGGGSHQQNGENKGTWKIVSGL